MKTIPKIAAALLCTATFQASAVYAQEANKHLIGITYKPIRDASGDKVAISFKTDFAAPLDASIILSGDAGDQHQVVSHPGIHPAKQDLQGTKVIGTEFTDQFTYGPGKNIFKELVTVHLQISVPDPQPPGSPVSAALDIDVSGIDDYFSVLTQAGTQEQRVTDLQAQLGQTPPTPKVAVEAVSALDQSISLQASTDNPVRLTAYVYLGSDADAAKSQTLAGQSDPQTVEQGNPKTLIVRDLQPERNYVVVVRDQKNKPVALPILTDHVGAPLKTLPEINHAHVSIQGQIVKLKEVVLSLQIHDVAKLKPTIQKLSSTGSWDDIATPKEETLAPEFQKPKEQFLYPLSVSVSLDPNAQYRAVVNARTAYDEANKDDVATSPKPFTGVSSVLFKMVAMKVTEKGLTLSTAGTEPLKMLCTAVLPGASVVVPSPDISKAQPSTSPSCEFTNARLFPPQPTTNPSVKPQPAPGAAAASNAPAQPVVDFTVHVEPNDQSGRSQDQTLSFSASLPTKDAKGKPIDWATVTKGVQAGSATDSKKPLISGALGTILRLFLSVAPTSRPAAHRALSFASGRNIENFAVFSHVVLGKCWLEGARCEPFQCGGEGVARSLKKKNGIEG